MDLEEAYLNLLVEDYSTENNLRESLSEKHTKSYTTNRMSITIFRNLEKNQVPVFSKKDRKRLTAMN